jgi:hypothetical protein
MSTPSPFNPYGGDANVHSVPNYKVPMVDVMTDGKLTNNRVWYRYFQNNADTDEYDACKYAELPAQVTAGGRGFVTDATASTFYSIVAGGGALFVPVFFDGVNWRVG